jgi:dihydroorotase
MKLLIRNGRIIDPGSGSDQQADLLVEGGIIKAIGTGLDASAAQTQIDASNAWVIPGLVDLSARLREPGLEYKATLRSELAAALTGGVTSLVCPPDTDPALDEPALVEMLTRRAESLKMTNVYPLGALTRGLEGETLTEMLQLAEAGCIGFSQATIPVRNTSVLLRALEYAATVKQKVWLAPVDAYIGRGGVAASGAVATRLGLAGVPVLTETVALHTIFELVRVSGCRVHLCRLSSAKGIELVRQARAEGLPLSADVSANHLHLTDTDIGFFDTNYRLEPPLRSQRDRDAIKLALADGTIDAICSDHTPVDDDAKQIPFGEAEAGATGLELLLSLTLKWGLEAEHLPARFLAPITSSPAALLGLKSGRLEIGRPADICVFDPKAYWRVSHETLISQGKNTPFDGYELPGRVLATIVGGEIGFAAGRDDKASARVTQK